MRILFLLPVFFIFSCGSETNLSPKEEYLRAHKKEKKPGTEYSLTNNSELIRPSDLGGHCSNPQGAPVQDSVSWKPIAKTLNVAEKKVVGTWAATLGKISVSTGNKMIMTDPLAGKTGMDALVDAIDKNKIAEGCAWIELYDDHTGFWNSCMLNNGVPACLDNVDPFSGEHSGSGVKFEWYLEGKKIRIKFEDCMKFPMEVKTEPSKGTYKSVTYTIRVKYWDLEMISSKGKKDGMDVYIIRDYLPEYKFTSPVKYEYSHSSKTLSGKVGKYKCMVID
jgi:hypothetical protein